MVTVAGDVSSKKAQESILAPTGCRATSMNLKLMLPVRDVAQGESEPGYSHQQRRC